MGRVGVVLGIEMSRLPRTGRDWHQLLELCSLSGVLLADPNGVYDPGVYNDRLLLGLKGTMSESLCRCRHSASYADPPVMPTTRHLKQVIHNTESAIRQYDLPGRAVALGWDASQVPVIDVDLGLSGAGRQPRGLPGAGRRGRAGPGRDRAGPGDVPAGPHKPTGTSCWSCAR